MSALHGRAASATGRIVIWRGGSLWIGRGGEPAEFHAHHAIQVSLAFRDSRLELRLPDDEWQTYESVIVAAQQLHAFDARDQWVAQLFIEPESRDGRGLQARYQAEGIAPLPPDLLSAHVTRLAEAYDARADDATLMSLGKAAIATLSCAAPEAPLDDRIVRAVARMRESLGAAIQLDVIAAEVHLSPERFRHLFVEQTGVRFRAYVLWLRLEQALAAYVAGESLTNAAHAGGFADSAHLSRTFRRMFGISAASIRLE